MKRVKAEVKKALREKFDSACMAYLCELLGMWELDPKFGDWVNNEIGGVYEYANELYLSMDEIRFIIDNQVEMKCVEEWNEYSMEAIDFGFPTLSLEKWFYGEPRASKETLERLRKKREEFEKMCEEEKDKLTSY